MYFRTVPILTPSINGRPISAGHLLTDFLNQETRVKCPSPCYAVNQAKVVPQKGRFTLLAINRRGLNDEDGDPIPKINTRVCATWSQRHGDKYLGELVSVITHKGSIHSGHWQTYTKTDSGTWYLNSDAHPVKQTSNPLNSKRKDETSQFLIYKNK